MKRATEDTLSLIAGAGIGMLAMYLLDPQSGERRRRQIAAAAREAAASAGEAITPLAAGVASGASRLGHRVMDRVSDFGSHAYDATRDFASRAGESISNSASDFSADVADRSRSMWHSGKRKVGLEDKTDHGFPIATTAAGGLGLFVLGAGVAWLFDRDRGEYRRHWLRDKSFSLFRDVGELSGRTGRHVRNLLRGTYSETRAKFRHDEPTDEQLEARVRSELGRVVSNMGNVTVLAEQGCITLLGSIPPNEIQAAEAAARSVRGVREVDCQFQAGAPQPQSQQQFAGD